MLPTVRAGSDSLYMCRGSECRPDYKSLFVMACLTFAFLNCANTVCGQQATQGLAAFVTRPVHPILIRNEHGPLMRVVVEVAKSVESRVSSLVFKLEGTDDLGDLESLTLFDTGDKEAFSPTTHLGASALPAAEIAFQLDQPLRAGKNVFWLSCRLKATAIWIMGLPLHVRQLRQRPEKSCPLMTRRPCDIASESLCESTTTMACILVAFLH